MSEITGGRLFARALQAEGVEFLFGLALARGRPAAGRARGARDPSRARPPRGSGRAHGRRPLQDDRQGGGGARQPGPRLGQPARRRDHCAARGHSGARHHLAAPARHRLPLAAFDVPGPGSARTVPAGGEVGRPDLRVGTHPRGGAPRLPRDVERAARARCTSSCPRPSSTRPARRRPRRCSRPPRIARARRSRQREQLDAGRRAARGRRAPARDRGRRRRPRRRERQPRWRSPRSSAAR